MQQFFITKYILNGGTSLSVAINVSEVRSSETSSCSSTLSLSNISASCAHGLSVSWVESY